MKIALICMYDAWALGLRKIANALSLAGHKVAIIHFRTPGIGQSDFILRHAQNYQTVSTKNCTTEQISVNWFNHDFTPWTQNELALLSELLENLQPDYIGVTTRSCYRNVIEDIFKCTPYRAKIIAGGHDATFEPTLYESMGVHAAVGPGEDYFAKLLGFDYGDTDLLGKYIEFPNYTITTNNIYLGTNYSAAQVTEPDAYYTMMGEGCVGSCGFCSAGRYREVTGKPRKIRNLDDVIAECQHADNAGFKQIYFLDSFFVAPTDYLLDFFRMYRRHVSARFFAQLHPAQCFNHPEIVDQAIMAGLNITVVGIQSGSDEINKTVYNRTSSHDETVEFAKMFHGQCDIDYHFITHNSAETEDHHIEALTLIDRLPKGERNNIVLRPLKIFENTPLALSGHKEISGPYEDNWLAMKLIRYLFPKRSSDHVLASMDDIKTWENMQVIYRSLMDKHKHELSAHIIGG